MENYLDIVEEMYKNGVWDANTVKTNVMHYFNNDEAKADDFLKKLIRTEYSLEEMKEALKRLTFDDTEVLIFPGDALDHLAPVTIATVFNDLPEEKKQRLLEQVKTEEAQPIVVNSGNDSYHIYLKGVRMDDDQSIVNNGGVDQDTIHDIIARSGEEAQKVIKKSDAAMKIEFGGTPSTTTTEPTHRFVVTPKIRIAPPASESIQQETSTEEITEKQMKEIAASASTKEPDSSVRYVPTTKERIDTLKKGAKKVKVLFIGGVLLLTYGYFITGAPSATLIVSAAYAAYLYNKVKNNKWNPNTDFGKSVKGILEKLIKKGEEKDKENEGMSK